VGDDDQSGVGGGLAREEEVDDRRPGRAVEIAGGLVGEDDLRTRCDGTGDGDALLLAAGELGGIVAEPVAEADGLELGPGAAERIVDAGELERDGDILERGHRREQVEALQDDADPAAPGAGERVLVERAVVDAGNADVTAARLLETGQDRHQRRFARARGTQYGEAVAAADVEIHALENVRPRLPGTQRQGDIARAYDDIESGFGAHIRYPPAMIDYRRYVALLLMVQLAAACSDDSAVREAPANQAEAAPAGPAPTPAPQADARLVLAFGDSLYAGYRLDQDESFPAALERALAARGMAARVANAGVSGDTTASGRQRLAFTLDGLDRPPDLAIVGLGGNDVLRGLSPEETRRNLDAILAELQRREIPILLTGMLAPRNMGPEYAVRFDAIFPELAQRYGAGLYPFFLDGVITRPGLMLDDGIHPNAQGIEAIAGRIAPMVAAELEESTAAAPDRRSG